jgi:ABC-type nitrate/sulfonate/bicarbonate transport system substrate-binding protein
LKNLHLIVFQGVQNFPNFAAETNGFFERRGLTVKTTFTRSSEQQRAGLANGEYDIAHSAVDNAVAMVEIAGEDVAIVVGLDHGFNKLIVQPDITSYEGLRGRIFGVDAVDTAFAIVVYEILKRKGIKQGDYQIELIGATRFRLEALKQKKVDFAMLNLPFNLFAQRAGLKVLDDPTNVIGAYQSTGGFVKRAWAQNNRDALTQYIAAYIEGLRWSMDPKNRSAAIELLKQRADIESDIAEQCYQEISDPKTGFAKDAKIDLAGMENVLALRADFSEKQNIDKVSRYVDETFYSDAIAAL